MPRCYNDFLPAADRLARLLYREEVYGPGMETLPAILEKHPKLLVIMNHGPMLGPAPALAALVRVMAHNGGGQRVPFGVAWRGFYQVPGLSQLASRFTQASGDLGVDEVVERLTSGPFNDCGLMPEGELCNAGNGVDVQPFRSHRFVEVAVRAGIPILLLAHTGTERLGQPVHVPSAAGALVGRLPEHMRRAISQSGVVSVPWLIGGRIPRLGLSCELLEPELGFEELTSKESAQRVSAAGRRVRARLQRLVNQLVLEVDND
ncbi:hypothetical protein DES49_0458 [Halospina denitrificans]|uniref:Acyltransferase-like protein n=2 Tax=Halospina denitrificans TaxID=332522 RepID=A0A4R7K1M9_9GAMM|nr:hypothetical protein DES49_0458 [Halospina denitrificans]